MKNKIIAIALAIFALSSCQKAFKVSSVRFSKEGGTQTIEVVTAVTVPLASTVAIDMSEDTHVRFL